MCMFINRDNLYFHEAEEWCQNNHNGHLVYLENDQMAQDIKALIPSGGYYERFHVGNQIS